MLIEVLTNIYSLIDSYFKFMPSPLHLKTHIKYFNFFFVKFKIIFVLNYSLNNKNKNNTNKKKRREKLLKNIFYLFLNGKYLIFFVIDAFF